MIRTTLAIAGMISMLYIMRVTFIVFLVDGFPDIWNAVTIEILTFKDRHPFIYLCLPIFLLILLRMK